MKNKSKIMITVVILMLILSGCGGVSEADYKKLEERVKILEEKMGVQADSAGDTQNDGVTSAPSISPTDKVPPKGVYDLSDRSIDQIYYEIEAILSKRLSGEDAETRLMESLGLRYEPRTTQVDRKSGAIKMPFTNDGNRDAITYISIYFTMKEDGWNFDVERHINISLNICDSYRAEMVYKRLEDKRFTGAVKNTEDRKWTAYSGPGYIEMFLGDKYNTINIQMDLY